MVYEASKVYTMYLIRSWILIEYHINIRLSGRPPDCQHRISIEYPSLVGIEYPMNTLCALYRLLFGYPIVKGIDMRRLPPNQRLSHKFLVGATQVQYDIIMAESVRRGVAPTIIARECLRRGLDNLEPLPSQPTPTPAVSKSSLSTRRKRQAASRTGVAVMKQRQAEHDALCLPHLDAAKNPDDAVQRLEAAGILTPGGKTTWDKVSAWRICKRHGISYQERKREGK